jgi:hypothetical protein
LNISFQSGPLETQGTIPACPMQRADSEDLSSCLDPFHGRILWVMLSGFDDGDHRMVGLMPVHEAVQSMVMWAVVQKEPCVSAVPRLPAVTACPSSWNVLQPILCPNGCTSLCVYTDTHTSSSQHKYIFKIYCSGKPSE